MGNAASFANIRRYLVRHGPKLLVPTIMAFPCTVDAETLQAYAAKCDAAMGGPAYSVPAFRCDDPASTEVPVTHPFDVHGRPVDLNGPLKGNFVELYRTIKPDVTGQLDCHLQMA